MVSLWWNWSKDKEKSPTELTVEEKKLLQQYNNLSTETKEIFIKIFEGFDKIPKEKQEFIVQAIQIATNNHK